MLAFFHCVPVWPSRSCMRSSQRLSSWVYKKGDRSLSSSLETTVMVGLRSLTSRYQYSVKSGLYSDLLTSAWSTQKELERFECNYETMRRQTCNKASHVRAFGLAIQEAKEVWDRRCGQIPATSFHPLDVLDKSTWPEDWGGPTGEAREEDSVQEPPW